LGAAALCSVGAALPSNGRDDLGMLSPRLGTRKHDSISVLSLSAAHNVLAKDVNV
jgi:hypothetical protein